MSAVITTKWNKYESALLLDTYLMVANRTILRKDGVAMLSKRLRAAMQLVDINLSDQYRNENGISLQMSCIEYCFTNGTSGIPHFSSIFEDICELYKNENDKYSLLLAQAKKIYPLPNALVNASKPNDTVIITHKSLLDSEQQNTNYDSFYSATNSEERNDNIVAEPMTVYNKLSKSEGCLKAVLENKFSRGYRLNSIIERKKLVKFYEELNGIPCEISIDEIDNQVKKIGITNGNKVYFPDLMLSEEIKEKIQDYVQTRFDSGIEYIYYVVIQKTFDNELLDSQITNIELLKEYLHLMFPEYHYYKDYVGVRKGIKPDVDSEVFRFVKEAYIVVTEQDVVDALTYLPKKSIHLSFTFNGDVLISNNRNNERFHIDNFQISRKDIETITTDIAQIINRDEYISWNDFSNYLHNHLPHIFSDNSQITEFGVRNALKTLLKSVFNINNNVICSIDDEITVERILRSFIRTHETFTIEEVKELTSAFGTGLYWDQMTSEAIRINENKFVSRHSVNFSTDAIDKTLEEFCTGKYIAIEAVTLFSLLPTCEYPWNSFLLENYVDHYSKKFKVVHNQYLQRSVRGAIVRRSANINTLDELILDFLVSSPEQYTSADVLEVLKEEKLIARARYEGIEHIVDKAMLMRQNKNK